LFFVDDVTIGVGLHILAEVTGPWRQSSEAIFWLNFFLELGYNLSLQSPW